MNPFSKNEMSRMYSPLALVYNTPTTNESTSRSRLTWDTLDVAKDIDEDCGYPNTEAITIGLYKQFYDRMAIATRVVEIWPCESWVVPPTLFESEEIENETEFEKAWNELNQNLHIQSWFNSKEKNPIWDYLKRVDILSGVGSFGLLLIGIDDGKELSEPAELSDNSTGKRKITFLRAIDQSLIQITGYDQDINSRRYGLPENYNITLSGNEVEQTSSGNAEPSVTKHRVHWSRVIHIADNLGSSELFGVPRQRPVFNRIYDLTKLYGGSAEMYWQGALPGLSFETHPQLGGDVEVDQTAIKNAVQQYRSRLQRYLIGQGMSVKSLAPQVSDPSKHIEVQIDAICILLGVPKRIFVGSERGELASGQDATTWNNRIMSRQNGYVTNRIIVPFVDRLIMMGVLPTPKTYNVVWPDLDTLSETDQAAIAVQRTEAIAKYVMGNVDAVIDSPVDFMVSILGMSVDEAQDITVPTIQRLIEEDTEEDATFDKKGNNEKEKKTKEEKD